MVEAIFEDQGYYGKYQVAVNIICRGLSVLVCLVGHDI